MKIKKYKECEIEFNAVDSVVVVSSNYDDHQVKELVKKQFISLDSCNSDFKEMLKNDLANITISKKYVPIYNVEAMVNDDYIVAFKEEGVTTVHVVCGNDETRIDQESIENLHKEEVVRFEGDYHFSSTDYKGAFANRLVHLELKELRVQEEGLDELDIIDRFISKKTLRRLIEDKVTQAFNAQGNNQAKKYIASRHQNAKVIDCTQNTKIIDDKKTLYLVPVYEVVSIFAEEQYTSFVAGVDTMTDFDYPRGKAFIEFNKKARRNHLIRHMLTSLMFILLGTVGVFGLMFLNKVNKSFDSTYLIIGSIVLVIICLASLIAYLLKAKKYNSKKDYVLSKYESSTKKPKSLFLVSLIIIGAIDLLCIVGITTLLTFN